MKKFLLAAVCLISSFCVRAQVSGITHTYTSGRINVVVSDTMTHDSTTCSCTNNFYYTITVDSSFTGDSLQLVDTTSASLLLATANTTGVSPWVFTTTLSGFTAPDNVSISGGYFIGGWRVIKVIASADTLRYVDNIDSFPVTNPCSYGNISGNVYIDNNANCVYDSGDVGLAPFDFNVIETLSSPVGTLPYYLNSTGPAGFGYTIQQSWMTSYTVGLPPYYAFIFPYSPCYSGPTPITVLPDTTINIPLLCSSSIDLQAGILSSGNVRLHRSFYINPYVSNTGCDSTSGVLTFIKDSRVSYDSALSTNPAMTVSGDTLTWNYSGISNVTGGAYWNSFLSSLYLTPDSTLTVGDTLCFRAYTGVPAADINAANNDYSVCLPVVYSFDPNEKDVAPKGSGPEGFVSGSDTLTYTLHFQNTGTDMAYDIHVIDTLNSHINAASLRILGTSHNMTPKWLAPNIIEFDYNNIFLADSFTNEPASHGAVKFSVALNPGLPVGTQIKNTGYIYFDLNPAVVTNTTLNTIGAVTYVAPVAAHRDVKVYPNPATENITVEHLEGGTLSIVNVNGIVVLEQNITSDKAIIDVSRLANGVYFLKAVNKDNTATTKFIKY